MYDLYRYSALASEAEKGVAMGGTNPLPRKPGTDPIINTICTHKSNLYI